MTKIQKKRLVAAIIILLVLFVAILSSSWIVQTFEFINAATSSRTKNSMLSDEFKKELFSTEDINADCIQASSDKKVIELSLNEDKYNAFNKIKNQLCCKGWKCFENEGMQCSSFSKNEGEITWAFINCLSVGDGCSAVITVN